MHLIAALSASHPLAQRKKLDITELANEPLLVMGPGHASLNWFEAACHLAHMRPRTIFQSGNLHTLIELARTGYGISVLPSPVRIPTREIKALPLVYRKGSIGSWAMIAWHEQRFLAPFARQFIEELATAVRRDFPGRDLIRGAPPLPQPRTRFA